MKSALDQPAGVMIALLSGVVLAILPAWLYWDWLSNPLIKGDDFAFLADSRAGAEPFRHLWEPHNSHVVPVFRLATSTLCRVAGSLGNVPWVLTVANHALLVLLVIATGHFVAWETGSMGYGLGAMAWLGVSTVLQPAATWYSAGQTLGTGLFVMITLLSTQLSILRQQRLWLIPAFLAAAVAPMIWTGGVCAGIVGSVYLLWHRGRTGGRWAAAPLVGTLASLGVITWAAGASLIRAVSDSGAGDGIQPFRIVTHGAQAVVESLGFANLGLTTESMPLQSLALSLGLVWGWIASLLRSGRRPNALESVGLTLVLAPYGLAFALRSGFPFENLRDLGWYDTMPQIGTVLFGIGWLAGKCAGPRCPDRLTWMGFLGVGTTTVILLALHVPQVQQIRIDEAPEMTSSEKLRLPIPELQRLRAIYLASERSERQRRALQRLERAGVLGVRNGLSRDALRNQFGRVVVPGWPLAMKEQDALDLIELPERGGTLDPAQAAKMFPPLLSYEPPNRPPWLGAEAIWPPTEGASVP